MWTDSYLLNFGIVIVGLVVTAGVVIGLIYLVKAARRLHLPGMSTLPGVPAWLAAYWVSNWISIVFLTLITLLLVWLLLPAMFPVGYQAYVAHGGAAYSLVLLALILALALSIPRQGVRKAAIVVIVVIAFFAVAPPLWWSFWGYCAPNDTACLRKEATAATIKAEEERQKQVAAQRAIEAARQPAAAQCDVQRRPHRYPASKPAAKDNPGGVCALALFIKGHCVYFTQNYNEQPGGIICVNDDNEVAVRDMRNNPIDMPEDVDRVWSTAEAFDGSIGFWQPRYTKLLSWR